MTSLLISIYILFCWLFTIKYKFFHFESDCEKLIILIISPLFLLPLLIKIFLEKYKGPR